MKVSVIWLEHLGLPSGQTPTTAVPHDVPRGCGDTWDDVAVSGTFGALLLFPIRTTIRDDVESASNELKEKVTLHYHF